VFRAYLSVTLDTISQDQPSVPDLSYAETMDSVAVSREPMVASTAKIATDDREMRAVRAKVILGPAFGMRLYRYHSGGKSPVHQAVK
jgi:hypothetical protein